VGWLDEYRSTRDACDRGGGCSIPLPVSPSPTGRFPIDTAPRERFPSAGFRRELPEESCFPPWHGIRTIAMHCPPPRKGAGGGRGSGREAGGGLTNTVQPETRATGAGDVPSPSPSEPLPHGAIPHRYTATGEISFSWFQAWNSPKNPVFPSGTASELSPNTRPPPRKGAGGGAERAGRRGVIDCSHGKTSSVTRRDRGGGCSIPLPVSPSPTGRFPIDTAPRERFPSPGFRRELLEDPVFPRGTVSELSPCTARPLGRGRAEARNAPGGGGVA